MTACTLASVACVDNGRTFVVTIMANDAPCTLYVTRSGVEVHASRQSFNPLVCSRLETAARKIAYALCNAGVIPKTERAA